MSDARHEHGSGVVPAGSYQPGGKVRNPAGLSGGVAAMAPEAPIPPRPRENARQTAKAMKEATAPPYDPRHALGKPHVKVTDDMLVTPRKRRKPTRQPPPQQEAMFDDPPDAG